MRAGRDQGPDHQEGDAGPDLLAHTLAVHLETVEDVTEEATLQKETGQAADPPAIAAEERAEVTVARTLALVPGPTQDLSQQTESLSRLSEETEKRRKLMVQPVLPARALQKVLKQPIPTLKLQQRQTKSEWKVADAKQPQSCLRYSQR